MNNYFKGRMIYNMNQIEAKLAWKIIRDSYKF